MTAALFDGPPRSCLERVESMLAQYVGAALVLGFVIGLRLF